MRERGLCGWLRAIRGGGTPWSALPAEHRDLVGPSLAGACRTLAAWADRRVDDRLAADAFVRYYGLVTLPEELEAIAATIPAPGRSDGSHASVDTVARRRDRVVGLLEDALAADRNRRARPGAASSTRLLAFPQSSPQSPQLSTPPSWDADPFEGPAGFDRAGYERIRLWAWADIAPGAIHEAAIPLWQYEYFHGLRPAPHRRVGPASGRNPTRDRRRAHALLAVGRERHAAFKRTMRFEQLDRFTGPRQVLVPGAAAIEALDGMLIAWDGPPGDGRARLEQLVGCVSRAVQGDRPEAAALLALARDLAARIDPGQPLRTQLATVAATVARVRRDPAGIIAAHSAMHAAEVELLELGVDPRHPVKGNRVIGTEAEPVVRQALRAAQEAVRICTDLGLHDQALAELRRFSGLLAGGDPDEDFEPGGWLQQYRVTEASLVRHFAGRWRPQRALALADRAAGASLDLVAANDALPRSWGLTAALQLVGVEVDAARFSEDADRTRHLRAARARLDVARSLAPRLDDGTALTTASLSVALQARWWQVSLLEGSLDEVAAARAATFAACSDATLPTDLERVVELEHASELVGLEAAPVPVELAGALARRNDRSAAFTARNEKPSKTGG